MLTLIICLLLNNSVSKVYWWNSNPPVNNFTFQPRQTALKNATLFLNFMNSFNNS